MQTFHAPNDESTSARSPRGRGRRAPRRGFTLLEFEIAMIVFGISLTGLFPLSVMYMRAMRSLEHRYTAPGNWYLASPQDTWAKKLGACATLTRTDPGSSPAPPVLIVDDGDTGYSEVGGAWGVVADALAFQADYHRHSPPADGSLAVWTFTGIPAGWYSVEATWPAAADLANDALFTVFDNDQSIDAVSVNQQDAPSGSIYAGCLWQAISVKYLRTGVVRVELSGASTDAVAADAIRLIPVENKVQVVSLSRDLGSEDVTAHVSVEVRVPQ